MKYLIGIVLTIIVILTIGRDLLPFQNSMFTSHDSTQPARIVEFVYNLQHLQLPPRIAPHWSFGLGFPVFNFYAPTAYWITSLINIVGLSVIDSLKLSYLISMVLASIGMYLFLKNFFKPLPSVLGGVLYAFSPWVAVETFVRGNLAEMWFIALLPYAFYFLIKNAESQTYKNLTVTSLVLGLFFSVHNVLSPVGLVLSLIFALLLEKKKQNFIAIGVGLLLSSYFLIPAVVEVSSTYASMIAQQTKYGDHFLCVWQLWTTLSWGYGGSTPGCLKDGMSFMIGKIQIIFAFFGLLVFVGKFKSLTKNHRHIMTFITVLGIVTAFLTTYSSEPIWHALPFLAVFQFPWRLLIFPLFTCAFLAALFFNQLKLPLIHYFIFGITLLYIFQVNKYFHPPLLSQQAYEQKYVSEKYIFQEAAFAIPEYLPRTVIYEVWLRLKGTQFESYNGSAFKRTAQNGVLPLHKFSFWHIEPTQHEVDIVGRPRAKIAIYQQSPIQQLGNIISVLTLAGLGILTLSNSEVKSQKSKV